MFHSSGLISGLIQLFAFLCLATILLPLNPNMPASGLDQSWQFGMNQALHSNFSIGKDIVFTFGPYAFAYSKLFHPATDTLMLGSSLYLTLSFWFGLQHIFKSNKKIQTLCFYLTLVCLSYLLDPLFFCYPLLVGIWVYQCMSEQNSEQSSSNSTLISASFIVAPLGLLSLIKGSFLILSVAVLCLSSAYLIYFKQVRLAIISVLSVCSSFILFWLLAGQSLRLLPDYLLAIFNIASGYSSAMAVTGATTDIALYLIASICLLIVVYNTLPKNTIHRGFLLSLFLVFLFIAFKNGFVRHDAHAIIAGTALLFAALILAQIVHNYSAVIPVVLAFICWYQIDKQFVATNTERLLSTLVTGFSKSYTGFNTRLFNRLDLQSSYQDALQAIRQQYPLPVVPGTADVFGYHQSALIASGNHWTPRPVFQSYTVYSPQLAKLNHKYYQSERAPHYLFFKAKTIDRRLPSTEDGQLWPLLIHSYEPIQHKNDFLILKKLQRGETTSHLKPVSEWLSHFAEEIDLPESQDIQFIQIHFKTNTLGKISQLLFKTDALFITLKLNNQQTKRFRLIPGMAESGFIISPLVENTQDFADFYQPTSAVKLKQVRSFSIHTENQENLFYQPTFQVKLFQLENNQQTQ